MASHTYVIGCDPGLANAGYAVFELKEGGGEKIVEMGNCVTMASLKSSKIFVSDDNDRRMDEVYDFFDVVFDQWGGDCAVMCIEAQSIPRNSSAAAKCALGRAVVRAFARRTRIPTLSVRPQDIKQALCGTQKATKKEVKAEIVRRYPEATQHLSRYVGGQHEHPCDAAGAVVTCFNVDVFLMARKMVG